MARRIPSSAFYRIKDPRNLYASMRRDVGLLYEKSAYTSCTTLILCFIDALAAGKRRATRGRFIEYVAEHFPDLNNDLADTVRGKSGAEVLYTQYRNGLAHVRGPKANFALAQDHEVDGKYAAEIEVAGESTFLGLNVDRLARDFLDLVRGLENDAA